RGCPRNHGGAGCGSIARSALDAPGQGAPRPVHHRPQQAWRSAAGPRLAEPRRPRDDDCGLHAGPYPCRAGRTGPQARASPRPSPDTPGIAIAGATRPDQTVIAERIADLPGRLAEAAPRGPILVIIGRLMAMQMRVEGDSVPAKKDPARLHDDKMGCRQAHGAKLGK